LARSSTGNKPASAHTAYRIGAACPFDKMNLSLEASLGLDTEKKASHHYQHILNEINPNLLMISHQNVW